MSNCACRTDGWTVSEPCKLHIEFAKEYADALAARLAEAEALLREARDIWYEDGDPKECGSLCARIDAALAADQPKRDIPYAVWRQGWNAVAKEKAASDQPNTVQQGESGSTEPMRLRPSGSTESLLHSHQPTVVAECQHEWADARNNVISSGEWCRKCSLVRAGNEATGS